MKTVREICQLIQIQDEMIERIVKLEDELDYPKVGNIIMNLTDPTTATREEYDKLVAATGGDTKGDMLFLCIMKCVQIDYRKYQKMGIDEDIFIDTMKCFRRFIDESMKRYGYYCFDRGWWTFRQTSLRIFRIGQLEYEFTVKNGEDIISLHIPSNADISIEKTKESVTKARSFFKTFFPKYQNTNIVCTTWLLVPKLKELLPPTSRILGFQTLFDIGVNNPEPDGFIFWIYKKYYKNLNELPEDTSLQRNMKAYLLKGGKIGVSKGVMKI